MKYVYAYSGILFFLSLVLILFWLYPNYQKIVTLNKEIDYWQRLLKDRSNYLEQLKSFDKQVTDNKEIEKVNIALPLDEPATEPFRFLQEKAGATGVVVSDIGFKVTAFSPGSSPKANKRSLKPTSSQPVFSEPTAESAQETKSSLNQILNQPPSFFRVQSRYPLEKIELNFTVEGSYSAIKNFIRELEKSIRLINISSFSISPVGKTPKAGQTLNLLQAEISGSIYRYHHLNQ